MATEAEEPTETDKRVLAGTHIRHDCNNVISVNDVHCPYCKRYNASTSIDQCPTCGNSTKGNASVSDLKKEIKELKKQLKEKEALIDELSGE